MGSFDYHTPRFAALTAPDPQNGNIIYADQPAPVACFRLVINGLYKSLPHHPWQGPLALASMPDAGEPGAGRDGWVLRLVRRWHSA